MERECLAKEIHSLLQQLAEELKSLAKNGLNDGAKVLEVTTMHLLNVLYGWELRDLNEVKKNYPAADLGDFRRRIAVQVTINATPGKIKKIRETALNSSHNLSSDFDTLYILFFVSEKPKTPRNIFQPSDKPQLTTWDLSDVFAKLLKTEPKCLLEVLAVLQREMGKSGMRSREQANPKLFPPRFIHHAAEHFLGRQHELKLLDEAWDGDTNVFCIIAWGGVGKTALIAEWVQTRFVDTQWKTNIGLPALDAYFDWSFYDQGTSGISDETNARSGSLGDFFEQALIFFGDINPNLSGKGRRLADLVRRQRSLIILDGLEPLQYPPGHSHVGGILDPDLCDFIRALSQINSGLCIITSRQGISGLHGFRFTAYREHELEDLPINIAVALFRKMQIKGTERELILVCEKFGRHALTITILASYLSEAHDGDIARADCVRDLERADILTRDHRHRTVWKVLETYENWLTKAGNDNQKTIAILRIVGLFDRPATADCLAALRSEPVIPEVTDALNDVDEIEWNFLLKRLERARLISLRISAFEYPGLHKMWDVNTHPLIREYFAKQMSRRHPIAWKRAHSRIFDYITASTEYWPETLLGLQPLYQAVRHGCLAGRQGQARQFVYVERILRGCDYGGFFSLKQLGAAASDLEAITAFFDQPWTVVSPELDIIFHGWIFNEAAIRLQCLGRISEAVMPMKAGIALSEKMEHWRNAAQGCITLADLTSGLGDLAVAIAISEKAIDFADRDKDEFMKLYARGSAGEALFKANHIHKASVLFNEAEKLQALYQPHLPLLYSVIGYAYSDFKLSTAERISWAVVLGLGNKLTHEDGEFCPTIGEDDRFNLQKCLMACHEAIHRAMQCFELEHEGLGVVDIALDQIIQARALNYYELLSNDGPPDLEELNRVTQEALDGLREANDLSQLPRSLLAAAFYHGTLGENLEKAEKMLEEAQQIAERGPMPLYLADVHLYRARLFGRIEAQERQQKFPYIDPKGELVEARCLIEKHGYWRRKEELEDAEKVALNWN